MTNYINSVILLSKTNKLAIVIPLLFIAIPFVGSKFYKKGEWNDEFFDIKQVNAIRGFCAIGILLHHLSQRTAASWLESRYIIHGLDFFVDIGYIFTGMFIFISGYGLYKSYKNKENYFVDYFSKRLFPLVLAYITTSLIYYLYKGISSTYTWFIFAIGYCYIIFYIAFKKIKNEYISLLTVLLSLGLYCCFCKFMMFGGWWYNSIGLFFVGIVFAKFEKYIVKFFKKFYIPLLFVALILMLVCRYYGQHYENIIYNVTKESLYDSYSILIIIYRFLASLFFVLLIILVSLKIQFNNKVLLFYNSISLEFYLIQGLFVHAFSYSYFDAIKSIYYIKNIVLYIVVVFVLTTLSAFIINFIDKKIVQFWHYFKQREEKEIAFVGKGLKKLFIAMGVVLVLYLIVYGVIGIISDNKIKNNIKEYTDKYITYADVNGKKMATYVAGNGKDTLVIMSGNDDPCPTLSMRYLADELSSDYKVVVLDYLGTGFSDDPTTNRSSKNIAYEIHEALQDLGINKKYILVPEYISGIYAQEYVKKYKDEVKAVIAIESEVSSEWMDVARSSGMSIMEYNKCKQRDSILNYCLARFLNVTGIDELAWPLLKSFYVSGLDKSELEIAKYLVFDRIYNSTYVNETKHKYDNIVKSNSAQYPRNKYIIDILAYSDASELKNRGINSEEAHAKACFDRARHKVEYVYDIYSCFFRQPRTLKELINKSIEYIK